MKVGVLGSGEVGKRLAGGFASRGHEVTIGSRNPEKLQTFVDESGGRIRAGTFEEAARFGELIAIATLFAGTREALELAGPQNFSSKIAIDATNPLKFEEGKLPELSVGLDDSAGEQIQRQLPDAKVVKAFNIIGNAHMIDPHFAGGLPTMFIAGNDESAKKTVAGIVESFGWKNEVIDMGGIEESRGLEAMAVVWIHYGIRSGSWNHAFKLLR